MKIAVIPDLHVPAHDSRALALAIKVIKEFCPDVLVQMGDLADFYMLSQFDKDPRKTRTLSHELATAHQVLDRLDLAPRKVFICGNHDLRLQTYILKHAPALVGHVTIESAYRLKEKGWEYYPYQEPCTIGDISFVHDLGYAGKNSLRQTIDSYPANVVIAHTHRWEMMARGNLKRETMTIANFGWLGDSREIDYLPSVKVKQDWVRGFGLIYLDGQRSFISPVKISKGKCMVEGKIYSA